MTSDQDKGLISALFDFSFNTFVTTRLIKALYALGAALGTLVGVVALLSGLRGGSLSAVGALILVPAVYLLFLMYLRVTLEVLAVVFRIAENTDRMARGDRT